MANKKLKRTHARKTICAIFALATAMPFLSVIGPEVNKAFKNIMKVDAGSIIDKYVDDKTRVAGYVAAPSDYSYRDTTNDVVYAKTQTNAAGKTSVSAVIKLDKKWSRDVKAYYHVENYTAIKDTDYTAPTDSYVTIPVNSTSATVTISTTPAMFGVQNDKSDFVLSRAFRFVLDSLEDSVGNKFPVYDGKDNGFRSESGLYKNDIYCLCGHKYTYNAVDQYEDGYDADGVKMFDDYSDYLTQEFGTGIGDKTKNTYDIGGYDDRSYGRRYCAKWYPSLSNGGFRVVPYQAHSYYDSTTQKYSIYRDWLNRITKPGLGHAYGSFNVFFNQDDDPKDNYLEEFYLGDYQYCSKVKSSEDPGFDWKTTTNNDDDKLIDLNSDHWNWGILLRCNSEAKTQPGRKDDTWYVEEDSLEKWAEYIKRVADNDKTLDADEKIVGGYTINSKYSIPSLVKQIKVVNYDKAVAKNFAGQNDKKICWYVLPHNDKEENFGMCLMHQHFKHNFTDFSNLGMKGNVYFTVLDDVAPTFDKTDDAKVGFETGSLGKEGKIRVSVRFNEPVQTFEHSYFKASLGTQTVEFRPVAGQLPGCDTVCYEFDTSSLSDIAANKVSITSSILYDKPEEGDNKIYYQIRDFAQTGGNALDVTDSNKYLKGSSCEVSLIKKDPVLSSLSSGVAKDPRQGATAEISVSYLSYGKIYYTFVKEEGQSTIVPGFSDEVVSNSKMYSSVVPVSNLGNNQVVKLDMPASPDRTGDYYCFVKAVSNLDAIQTLPKDALNGVDIKSGIGPFRVDNKAPKIKISPDAETFNANKRKFNIEVEENAAIDSVTVKLNKTSGELSDQINTFDVKVIESGQGSGIYTGSFTLTLSGILDKYYTIKETGKHVFSPDLEYEDFSLTFSASDKAGNSTTKFEWEGEETTQPVTYPYSAHENLPLLEPEVSTDSLLPEITGTYIYPCGTSFTLHSKYNDDVVGYLEGSVVKLPKTDSTKTYYESYSDETTGISISQGEPAKQNTIVVTLDQPGNYEVVVRNKEGNYSDAYKFCISDNLNDPTPNAERALDSFNLVPRVDVWELNDDSLLYYLDNAAKYHAKLYNGVYNPVFSSVNAAKTYIRAHEYEDLYLVKLTGQLADYLNKSGGVSGFSKANNEQTIAREGQWWVRYKNSSWTIGATASTAWGYYFYSETSASEVSIDLDTINKNKVLVNQIDRVSDLLANNGKTIYLVDDDHIDIKTNAPKLTAGQIEISNGFVLTETLSGSAVSAITCPRDTELYSNTVYVYNGVEEQQYRLASNMPVIMNSDISLYATLAIGEPQYFKIDCKDGVPLKEALNQNGVAPSGIYTLIEVSSDGANKFDVYIDKDNPYAEVGRSIFDSVEGTTTDTTSELDGSFNADFYSKNFSINGVPLSKEGFEVDQYAYVAIFKSSKLVECYYLNQINAPIILDDGIYNIVVGDRSGNRYSFRAFVSGEDINVQFKPRPDNSKLSINITNREESELLKYEVYCNNELINNELTNPKSYSISGTYYVVVQDQYGNKLTSDPFTFTKVSPELHIASVVNGYIQEYKDNVAHPHIVKTVGDDSISIKTDAILRLTYLPETSGINIVGCPSNYYTDNGKGVITFNQSCDFSFNIYYLDNEEEYVHYEVTYDNSEPDIYGEYYSSTYDFLDLKPSNFDKETQTPNSLDYVTNVDLVDGGDVTKTSIISHGSTICTDYMYFRITDNTEVKSVSVKRDGVEVPITFLDQGYNGYEFYMEGIPGEYKVTAVDIFGKETYILFKVDDETFTTATIDGKDVSPVGPIVDGQHETIYGNSEAKIVCEAGSKIVLRYEDENGVYAIVINVSDDGAVTTSYTLLEDGVIKIVSDEENETEISSFPYRPFENIDLELVKKNGLVTITYNAGSTKSNLDVRVSRDDECVNLYNMEFSNEFKTPTFMDEGFEVEPKGKYVYTSHEVVIVDSDEEIANILVTYNPDKEDFENATYVEYSNEYEFRNGFYNFIITNKYGIKQEFTAVVSDNLNVNVTETFLEKPSETYSLNEENVFTSNNTIEITGYNVAYMREESGYGTMINDGSKTSLIFTQPGTYKISVIDNNNNRANITAIINSTPIEYNESYLVGYNEAALLKDQGYTNQTLSVDLDQDTLEEKEITQVFYTYNGEVYTLYGYNGKNAWVAFNEENFENVIGSLGDGVYKVYFSNKYGDVCVKEINYRGTPTLEIERLTNNSLDPEKISVEEATGNGVWSNQKVSFSTSLGEEQYEFYVKNADSNTYLKQYINYAFELNRTSLYGEVHYTIKYLDAYGNSYEIPVNLLRRQLSFDLSNVKEIEYDGTKYTKENFYFEFDPGDVSMEYKFNKGEFVEYNSNDLLFKDGVYEFRLYDKSGNQAYHVVTKDSVVTFSAKIDGDAMAAYCGGVFNGSQVKITSTAAEDVKIVSAKINGYIVETDGLIFNKTGHYELLLKDKVGNVEYFHFYMIGHEINSFDYVTPNDYVVSAAYFVNSDGIRTTAMDKVTENNTHVDLSNVEEGDYEIQVKNRFDNSITIVSIKIDKKTPTAVLDGCNNGDTTTKEISLKNLESGDIVTVYKDGKVVQQVEIGVGKKMESIKEGGSYRIVVENRAGSKVEYSFEKLTIANGALSTLIIVGLVLVSGGFFAVLVLRNRSKSDE